MSQNPGWKLSQRLHGWATSGHSSIIRANGSKSQRCLVGHIVAPVELVLHRWHTFIFRELQWPHTSYCWMVRDPQTAGKSWGKKQHFLSSLHVKGHSIMMRPRGKLSWATAPCRMVRFSTQRNSLWAHSTDREWKLQPPAWKISHPAHSSLLFSPSY